MAEGFRAAASAENTSNGTDVSVTIPAGVQANDGLVAVYTTDGTGSTVTTPAGWSLRAGPIDKGTVLRAYVFEKYATAGDAGSTLTVTKSVADATKRQLTVAAYSGVDLTEFIGDFASNVETTAGLTHLIPTVTAVGTGSWRAAFVVDRGSPASTDWTPPASLPSERAQLIGSGTGTSSTDWADSGAPVAAGAYSGDVFTSASNSTANAITLALIIKPAGGSPATATPAVLTTSVSFLAPTVITGGTVTVAPSVLRMSTMFLPLEGSETDTVTPDTLNASVAFLAPVITAQQQALTVPDPLVMSVSFFAPSITAEGSPPPPDENPPPSTTRRFRGPTRTETWPLTPDSRLSVKVEINQTLYRKDGVWLIGENLNWTDLTGVDRLYIGGYELELTDAQLDELIAAGLGQYVVDGA